MHPSAQPALLCLKKPYADTVPNTAANIRMFPVVGECLIGLGREPKCLQGGKAISNRVGLSIALIQTKKCDTSV